MDTISPSMHSPASVSLPVSPDDDSRFDRTASPSPACPKETLQQCRVSRIIQFHVHTHTPCPEPNTKGFSTLFSQLIIDDNGDILPIAKSAFFKIGNIHDKAPLSTMIERFMEEKLEYIMQLYNETYGDILADPGIEIFNWLQLILDKSK